MENIYSQAPMGGRTTHHIKVILAGESGVGKSSFISRLKGERIDGTQPTIGVDFVAFYLASKHRENEFVRVFVWDVAGSSRYDAMTAGYYREFTGALIMYNITSLESFQQLRRWTDKLLRVAHEQYDANKHTKLGSRGSDGLSTTERQPVECLILGNKADLVAKDHGSRKIETTTSQKFAHELGVSALEISCLSDSRESMIAVFHLLVDTILENPVIEARVRIPEAKQREEGSAFLFF